MLRWKTGMALANGLRIAWEETGDPGGPPVVLIMGLAAQCIMWPEPFCRDLATRGFRVIRFDNRDIGLSDGADRGVRFNMTADWVRVRAGLPVRANYTVHDMAADTVGLLDALGLDRVHLVGVSMGGMIAQLVSARHPRRVRSLTLIMSHSNHPWHSIPRASLLLGMGALGVGARSREQAIARQIQIFRTIGSPAFPRPESELREAFGRAYDRSFRPGGVLRQTHAIVATPCFDRDAERITAPTQVIHGTADPLVPPVNGRRLAKLIRGARLEILHGMGHDLPAELMPRLAELCARNAARA